MDAMDERDYTRFEFEMGFRGYCILQQSPGNIYDISVSMRSREILLDIHLNSTHGWCIFVMNRWPGIQADDIGYD